MNRKRSGKVSSDFIVSYKGQDCLQPDYLQQGTLPRSLDSISSPVSTFDLPSRD
jgi:hypothetical protein